MEIFFYSMENFRLDSNELNSNKFNLNDILFKLNFCSDPDGKVFFDLFLFQKLLNPKDPDSTIEVEEINLERKGLLWILKRLSFCNISEEFYFSEKYQKKLNLYTFKITEKTFNFKKEIKKNFCVLLKKEIFKDLIEKQDTEEIIEKIKNILVDFIFYCKEKISFSFKTSPKI